MLHDLNGDTTPLLAQDQNFHKLVNNFLDLATPAAHSTGAPGRQRHQLRNGTHVGGLADLRRV